MVELTRRSLVLAKIETTSGTDSTPTTAANAIEGIDVEIKRMKPPVERLNQNVSLMRKPSIVGEEFYEISFKAEIQKTGTAGTPPRLGALLKACGMSQTIITGATPVVKYRDISSSFETCTIWVYKGGRLFKAVGCSGNVKGTFEAGKFAMLEFTMQGSVGAAISIAAMPTDAVYDDAAGSVPLCKAGVFKYNSKISLCASLMDFDLGNTITPRRCLSSTYVVQGFEVTDRKPVASINPETQVYTSFDFYGDALTNQRPLEYEVANAFTVYIPQFNPFSPEFEDVDGILHDKINGEIAESTSDGYSIELEWAG